MGEHAILQKEAFLERFMQPMHAFYVKSSPILFTVVNKFLQMVCIKIALCILLYFDLLVVVGQNIHTENCSTAF